MFVRKSFGIFSFHPILCLQFYQHSKNLPFHSNLNIFQIVLMKTIVHILSQYKKRDHLIQAGINDGLVVVKSEENVTVTHSNVSCYCPLSELMAFELNRIFSCTHVTSFDRIFHLYASHHLFIIIHQRIILMNANGSVFWDALSDLQMHPKQL